MNESANRIQDIIESSGNNFHSNVIRFLRERKWTVLISPYYNDNLSDKAREIGIIAEKAFDISDIHGRFKGRINIRLIMECKYINSETVFWFDIKNIKKAEERVVTDSPLRRDQYIQRHHYMSNCKVAKLFSSKKDKDLMNEPVYKAINQTLNAMIYFRDSPSNIEERDIIRTVTYPTVILNNFKNLYRLDIGENNYSLLTESFFQLEVNYAYLDSRKQNMNEYFLIDFVDFSQVDNYLYK
jgi:hypothetical protein